MAEYIEGGLTFTAGEDLAKNRCVRLSASRTLSYADAGQDWIGITDYAVSSGALVSITPKNTVGTVKVCAAAAIAANALASVADDGMVATTSGGPGQIQVLTAANDADEIVEAIILGDMASVGVWDDTGTAGSGVVLGATAKQFAALDAADDGGAALTAGWYAARYSQMLIGTAPGASVSAFGMCGELHMNANKSAGHNFAGVYGYAELQTGKTITAADNLSFSAILAGLDVPSGAVIAANTVASCIAMGGGFGGTHTGKIAALHCTNPGAGEYDYFLQTGWDAGGGDGTGLSETITANTDKMTKGLKIRLGDTAWWIVLQSATS